jgi:MarC family membrane protein
MASLQTFIDFILGSLAALFPVIDPIGSVPIFLVLTAGMPMTLRQAYARRIAMNVILLLIGFLLVGGSILRFFGVSLEVVRIAGGIVVFHAAWRTMNAEPKLDTVENEEAVHRADQHADIAFMPMTIPLLAGPGAIAVTLGISGPGRSRLYAGNRGAFDGRGNCDRTDRYPHLHCPALLYPATQVAGGWRYPCPESITGIICHGHWGAVDPQWHCRLDSVIVSKSLGREAVVHCCTIKFLECQVGAGKFDIEFLSRFDQAADRSLPAD